MESSLSSSPRWIDEHGRGVVYATGLTLALVAIALLMFRGYEGRAETMNENGIVEQSQIDCPPARTAMTRSFNKADPRTPDVVRVCVETGRGRAFVTGILLFFIGVGTWSIAQLPERARRRSRAEASRWDEAIASARARTDTSERRTG